MEPKETVQVYGGAHVRARLGNRNRGARFVVGALAKRDHHVETIDGTTLKDGDQDLSAFTRRDGATKECRSKSEAQKGESTVLDEDAS